MNARDSMDDHVTPDDLSGFIRAYNAGRRRRERRRILLVNPIIVALVIIAFAAAAALFVLVFFSDRPAWADAKPPAAPPVARAAGPIGPAGRAPPCPPSAAAPAGPTLTRNAERGTGNAERRLLAAIRAVESGGAGDAPDGDNGRAIGPYQIHRLYWLDARMAFGVYEDCRRPEYARAVVLAYWRRHAPDSLLAMDAEHLARVHNGGPAGHLKAATAGYWRKVERELQRGMR